MVLKKLAKSQYGIIELRYGYSGNGMVNRNGVRNRTVL